MSKSEENKAMVRRFFEAFARGFHALEYRAEIGRLMALGVEPPEEDEA